MPYRILLPIDYEAVARHLLGQQTEGSCDDPQSEVEFQFFRAALESHLVSLMSGRPFNEDKELTKLLFARYTDHGVVNKVSVTEYPGTIIRLGGKALQMPLVKIEIEY